MLNRLRVIALFIICVTPLMADWNQDFDTQTEQLIKQLSPLQNNRYTETIQMFKKIRARLLRDRTLLQKIKTTHSDQRLIIIDRRNGVIIKKRKNNIFHDLYPWEISYLAGTDEYVVPSFPVEIGGKIVIIQKLEDFIIGTSKFGHPADVVKKVSLESYWKAMLQAYILGFSDLVLPNIGINSKGIVRYFDNESCLIYRNTPFKNEQSFRVGFFCQAIDWPQYEEPLSAIGANRIGRFVDSFVDTFSDQLHTYLTLRSTSIFENGLHVRIENLKQFQYEKGATFRQFYQSLYPKMTPGLHSLKKIISEAFNRPVGYGTTLLYATVLIKKAELNDQQMNALNKWIDTYID